MEIQPKTFFLVDAMAMAFRNFHAFGARPISNSQGLPTSAIFGCAQYMTKLISEQKPDYIVIACDSAEPTFRHRMYDRYKANRSAMPEDLAAQIPHLYRMFEAMGCKLLKRPGVEADDLIGALVKKYRGVDTRCYIVSGDKDFMQLIDENTFLYVPLKGGESKVLGPEGPREKFGVEPHQVTDVLAIMGDSSDNVPGVKGIGEKGASKLVHEFGSLEKIYQRIEEIPNPKLRDKLLEHREMALLSKKLVTIECDLGDLPELLALKCPEHFGSEALLQFYEEMEFRRLSELVKNDLKSAKPQVALIQTHQTYQCVDSLTRWNELREELGQAETFAFDSETTGLDIISDQPIGFSFSTRPGHAWYLPIHPTHQKNIAIDELRQQLHSLLSDRQKCIVAHNFKFDLQMLANAGLPWPAKMADTMMASYVCNSTQRSHGLDYCSLNFLKHEKIPTSSLIGKEGQLSMIDADLDALTRYACEDADMTLRLHQYFEPQIDELNLRKVYETIEIPLIPVLAKMEQRGVYVNPRTLRDISTEFTKKAELLTTRIHQLAGEEFNIQSTKQLQHILFEKLKLHEELGLTRLKKNKSGFSTDVSVLEKMSGHPLPDALLEYRSVTKLLNTYVDALPQLIHPKTGRIHTSFHQTGTATGRLSSSEPNLQNIPIRTAMGQLIRKSFATEQDRGIVIAADYSQIELRILAHMSEDEGLISAFRDNKDIHTETAARIFGVKAEQVDREMRSQAKAINFGIIYGMGPSRLAKETGVSYREAEAFIEKYFATYPGIARYSEKAVKAAKDEQASRTLFGRRRPILDDEPGINSENVAVNSPIQGTAADIVKLAMLRAESALQEAPTKMLIQVHDELVFESTEDEHTEVCRLIKDAMEKATELAVPLVIEVGTGKNWLEAH